MSYGYDQTRSNTLRIWLIIVSALMVIGLTTAHFISRAYRRYKKEQEELAAVNVNVSEGGAIVAPSRTPEPTATMTNLPEPSKTRTVTPAGESKPDATSTPNPNKNVFPYSVNEILYLSESYNLGRKWKPGDKIAENVSESEYNGIYDLLWAEHVQRKQALSTGVFPDYTLLNDGLAITQLKNYYNRSIVKDCTVKINIVEDQFQVFVIEFDGTTARTMTVKVENRVDSCSARTVYNDYYAYENLVRKFYTGDGQTVWKIIEHTANMGVK